MSDDGFFDDDMDLALLAQVEQQATSVRTHSKPAFKPIASTSKLPPASSGTMRQTTLGSSGKSQLVQTTLDGSTVTAKTRIVAVPRGTRPEKAPVLKATKEWDRSIWAKRGWGSTRAAKKKAKGKRKACDSDEDEEDAEEDEDVDWGCDETINDLDMDPTRPPPPMKLRLDEEAAETYIYPMSRGMRLYQYNIVRKALFNNVLVSLPTGLGKTFIAAAVMYNFWRWYPEGKIIFMAPTRPLVNQQIEACYSIAPIPPADCAEMTGQDAPAIRQAAWAKRRVFYCTPQTVQNDLKGGRIDASKIVCLVLDEAHKASGDFAYCGVVRYLMSKNPHFRVLALSATPGSTPEAVQAVVDALHIGHIECRTDASMDVQKYMHRKEIVQQIVPLTPEFVSIRDNWAAIMREYAHPLIDKNILHGGCRNVVNMSSYVIQMAMQSCGKQKATWAFPALGILHKMSMAMDHLLTQSLSSFTKFLYDLIELAKEKKGTYKTLVDKPKFITVKREADQLKNAPGTYPHPKMDILKTSLVAHFTQDAQSSDSRAIVFCQYRDVVEEIVEVLNRDKPLIKATRFVGQGTDKSGKRGIAQKEQVATIERFKKGDFNVLVATSVGEEGLDIGEVDVIYCYDVGKSSIKMLQRIGRTGRAKEGKVLMLMNEDREDKNFSIAEEKYQDVQNAIVSGKVLEVYKDCDALNPHKKDIRAVETTLEAMPFQRISLSVSTNSRKTSTKEAKKPKDPKRNMPAAQPDLNLGFRKASEAAPPEPAKKKKPLYLQIRERKEPPALLSLEKLGELQAAWDKEETTDPSALHIDFVGKSVPTNLRSGKIGPSRSRSSLARVLALGHCITSKPSTLDKWEAEIWPSFQASDVHWWHKDFKGTCTKEHQPCFKPPRAFTSPLNPAKATAAAGVLQERDTAQPDVAREPPLPAKKAKLSKKSKVVDLDSDGEEESAVVYLEGLGPPPKKRISSKKKSARDSLSDSDGDLPPAIPSAVVRLDPDSESDEEDAIRPPAPARPFVMPMAIDSDDMLEHALSALPKRTATSRSPPAGLARPEIPKPVKAAPRKPALSKPIEIPDTSSEDDLVPAPDFSPIIPRTHRASSLLAPPSPPRMAGGFFPVPSMLDSDDVGFGGGPLTPLTAPVREESASPGQPQLQPIALDSLPPAPADNDEFDFDDFDPIDESALEKMDAWEDNLRQQKEKQLMPPPAARPPKRSSLDDLNEARRKLAKTEAVHLPRRAPPARPMVAEDSSPAVVRPGHRKRALPPLSDEAFAHLNARSAEAPQKKLSKRTKQPKKAKAHNPFIENSQAVDSDDANADTSHSEASEDSSDREFVAGSEDINTPDEKMQQYYRDSLLSQHPAAAAFKGSVQKPGAFKLRYAAAANAASRSFATQVRHSDSEVSDYLESSFCVPDGVVEFESSEA